MQLCESTSTTSSPAPSSSSASGEGLEIKSITSFLINLYNLVSDSTSDHIVRWIPKNKTFMILDQETFTDVILPKYFRHANFTSFTRQLNMYGFRKMNPRQKLMQVFYHPRFQKDQKDMLHDIQRRTQDSKKSKKADDIILMLGGKRQAPKCSQDTDSTATEADHALPTFKAQNLEQTLLLETLKFLKQRVQK